MLHLNPIRVSLFTNKEFEHIVSFSIGQGKSSPELEYANSAHFIESNRAYGYVEHSGYTSRWESNLMKVYRQVNFYKAPEEEGPGNVLVFSAYFPGEWANEPTNFQAMKFLESLELNPKASIQLKDRWTRLVSQLREQVVSLYPHYNNDNLNS